MAVATYVLTKKSPAFDNQIAASGSGPVATSGVEDEWRFHIQNIEIMYRRKNQYKTTDGSIDFNYIEANYTVECSREHIWTTASGGDFFMPHILELKSDSTTGGIGLSGSIRTKQFGHFQRLVREGDRESQERGVDTIIACRLPGAYEAAFDTSNTVNGTIFDICEVAKAVSCPSFELAFLDL